MTRRGALGLLVAVLMTACDPAFDACVTVTSCETAEPIVGARVEFEDYDAEDYTDPDGVACYGNAGVLRRKMVIVVDKPGYPLERTEVETPGGAGHFDTAVCLTPE